MADCSSIDCLVTPYVDGELAAADRETVADHLARCRPCRARVDAEQTARDLVRRQQAALRQPPASDSLRISCARLAGQTFPSSPSQSLPQAPPLARSRTWRSRLAPLALAATIVLVVGAAFLYRLTDSSAQVLAAELTADHLKCFAINGVLGTHESSSTVEASLASGFGWPAQLSDAGEAGLTVVGSRPCLYAQGRVAHVMFTHHGRPVSLFMLPNAVRSEQYVKVLGHEAAIWCTGKRTFVLIARESRSEVERMATAMHASLQ